MEAKFLQTAFLEMNVKEIKGKNHNPRILQYHNATQLKASSDEVPWCSAFLNFIVERCHVVGTDSAMVRSFERWGKLLKKPIPGCIAVLSRGDNPDFGHGGFYLYETKKNIVLLAGNQGDSVCIASFPKSRLICYRGYKTGQ